MVYYMNDISRHLYSGTDNNVTKSIRDVSPKIHLLDPNEYPLLSLIRTLRKHTVSNVKREWYLDVFPEMSATVATPDATSGVSTSISVGSGEGALFRPYDIWYVSETGERILIESVIADTLTIIRNIGGDSPSGTGTYDIDSGDTLFYVGTAMPSGSNARATLMTQETLEYNYIQTFKEPISVTEEVKATALYGGADLPYLRMKHGIKHQRDMERAFWFGIRGRLKASEVTALSTAGEGSIHHMGGVFTYMSASNTNSNTSGSLTEDEFATYLQTIFRYGNQVKTMFNSPTAASVVDSFGRDKIQTVPTGTTAGMVVKRYISTHGDLNMVYNKLFADMANSSGATDFGACSVIIDLEDLLFCVQRDTRLEMNIQLPEADLQMDQYLTAATLEFKQPLHHSDVYGWAV